MRRSLLTGSLALLAFVACEDTIVGTIDPILTVDPQELDFGTVELTQQVVKTVRIQNLETVPAVLSGIEVEDDCDGCFVVQNPVENLIGFGFHDLEVRYRSQRLAAATGTVTIATDDPNAPELKVFLIGRGSDMRRPDVEVLPERIDFGFIPAGGIALASFVVRSTGTNDLLVDRIRIDPPSAPFRITTSTPTPEMPGVLEPGAQASVSLRAEVPESGTGTITATIYVETNVLEEKNVPGQPGVVQIPIGGLANRPPVAVPGDDLTVEPWSRVTLDGSESYDQDIPPDEPLTYRWRLVAKPDGSTTALERARTVRPSFWADLTGVYEVELVVIDSLGLESEPKVVLIEALPTNAIRIELTWDHPDSDLDLHFLRPTYEFCDCITDVHYRDCAREPIWFPQFPGANPRLDVDDRSGFGPENINLDGDGTDRYIPDGEYRIAVHYYASNEAVSSWPTNESNATVRVFVYGLLAAEVSRKLEQDNDLWEVGTLSWPSGTLTPSQGYFRGLLCPDPNE
ncbi:MAG: choice-of-anchor D domain-containing protein [Deltaproteobacteria bacterium]